jgi:hypothetical protein
LYEKHFNTGPNKKICFDIEPFKLKINGGFGGLHSVHPKPIVVESNSETTVLEIDCSSYYPTILAQILASKAFDDMAFYGIRPSDLASLIDGFKTTRIELKKENNPIHTIYKLIQNKIYGQTNAHFSKIYCPRLSWSVVLNGQILLAELISTLKPLLKDLHWVNTDGFICTVENKDISGLKERLSHFEKLYGMTIGTRDKLEVCYISGVNSVLRKSPKGEVRLKGINETFNAGSKYARDTITKLVESYKCKVLYDLTSEELWQILQKEAEKATPKA